MQHCCGPTAMRRVIEEELRLCSTTAASSLLAISYCFDRKFDRTVAYPKIYRIVESGTSLGNRARSARALIAMAICDAESI